MERDDQRRVDEVRKERSELENHIIDEYAAGRLSRRDFVRRGTIVGMSIPLVAWLAAACGGSSSSSGGGATTAASTGGAATGASTGTTPAAPAKQGGTLRAQVIVPSGALDPVQIADAGGLCMNAQTGQYTARSYSHPELRPIIAESWSPSPDASKWTYKIRQGVTFNDEANTPMTSKDVAATFNRLSDPANKSQALSALAGVLSKGAAQATDDTTVVFELDSPNGSFPWIISSDLYMSIILPENYDGGWEKTWIGTGPWKMTSYTPKVGVKLTRNPNYWGPKTPIDNLEITFYQDRQSAYLALQAKQADVMDAADYASGQAILNNKDQFNIIRLRASTHRELSMRTDKDPFTNKLTRQAVALTLDRPALVQGLWGGYADLGNDSPFAPVFATTNTSVPQRAQDLDKAKQLLAQAGQPNGFKTQLNAIKTGEVPQYAQIVQSSAKKIGVDINLVIQDSSSYYGDAVFGKSPWLDSIMSLVDYGHRGVPDLFLNAPLLSKGTWNAAHFKDPQYDALAKKYFAEPDLQKQKQLAGQIETLLLDETPIIFAYFYNSLTPTQKNVQGIVPTALNHLFMGEASFTS